MPPVADGVGCSKILEQRQFCALPGALPASLRRAVGVPRRISLSANAHWLGVSPSTPSSLCAFFHQRQADSIAKCMLALFFFFFGPPKPKSLFSLILDSLEMFTRGHLLCIWMFPLLRVVCERWARPHALINNRERFAYEARTRFSLQWHLSRCLLLGQVPFGCWAPASTTCRKIALLPLAVGLASSPTSDFHVSEFPKSFGFIFNRPVFA